MDNTSVASTGPPPVITYTKSNTLKVSTNPRISTDTVSYTHLDVYKRQEYEFNFYQIAAMEHCTASAIQKSVAIAKEKVKEMCIRDRVKSVRKPCRFMASDFIL